MKKAFLMGIMVFALVCLIVISYLAIHWRKPSVVSQEEVIYKRTLALATEGKAVEAIASWKKLMAEFPDSEYVDEALIHMGDFYLKESKLLEAKECYGKIVTGYPNSNSIRLAQEKLWDVKLKILFSPIETSDSLVYTVAPGDTLNSISQKFNTTVELIMKSNGLESDLIHPGMKLKVLTAKYSLIVDKSRNTLALKSNEEVLKVYSISTGGLGNPTPSGRFIIETKLLDPPWKNIPPGDPRNILGSRWMGFGEPFRTYGIHGTTEPESIGMHITKGCVRMYDDDIKEIFTIVPIGSEVIIVD